VILHIVLYGFETWFFILRGRLKLRVFQSRGRYLGQRRWKKLETGGNCIMRASWFVSLTKCYLDEMDVECSIYAWKRNAYTVLMGKLEEKRTLRRPG
jgi:hypothetical protein